MWSYRRSRTYVVYGALRDGRGTAIRSHGLKAFLGERAASNGELGGDARSASFRVDKNAFLFCLTTLRGKG